MGRKKERKQYEAKWPRSFDQRYSNVDERVGEGPTRKPETKEAGPGSMHGNHGRRTTMTKLIVHTFPHLTLLRLRLLLGSHA